MNLKALITSALLVLGTSSAAFAGPEVIVRGHVNHPVVVERPMRSIERSIERPIVRPIVERPGRPIGRPVYAPERFGRPIVVEHPVRPIVVRPVWHPVIRPIVRPVFANDYYPPVGYVADGFTTVGSFDFAFDGTQNIDLGAGRAIDTLRVAGDGNTEIFSVVVTYADGQQQTINCDQLGSFETNLGGNVVTSLQVTAHNAGAAPLQIQIA